MAALIKRKDDEARVTGFKSYGIVKPFAVLNDSEAANRLNDSFSVQNEPMGPPKPVKDTYFLEEPDRKTKPMKDRLYEHMSTLDIL